MRAAGDPQGEARAPPSNSRWVSGTRVRIGGPTLSSGLSWPWHWAHGDSGFKSCLSVSSGNGIPTR